MENEGIETGPAADELNPDGLVRDSDPTSLPPSITPAELQRQNERFWQQQGGTFPNAG